MESGRESNAIANVEDPILSPTWKRLVTFPIVYHDLWALYKQMEASLWTAEEINFKQDAQDLAQPESG
ncbi:hypothetical protein RvY_01841 [Ramazzottius varieornatus]|uniref:Uncharacterized protein n=1 Tax=Ramazzottius varieornatus TaxID=947166 RepID=A0A1D1ULJ8_RAMVA|nr:hypothetical protein RvY_01841 [Ramazzottius varieornatus]